MKNLIEKTLLTESIEFNGSVSELKEYIRFKRERKFKLDWISDTEFKFLANVSIGTVIVNHNPGFFDGIKGYAKLTELNNGKTKIELRTKLRVEMYIIGVLFLVFLSIFLFSNENLPIWILFLFPAMILWFGFVYRFQEKRLFEKVRQYLTKDGILKFK
tara:strand:+ start:3446 stop:3922 length:477 start_codon:yes stop_codon:yes gene_type:complete